MATSKSIPVVNRSHEKDRIGDVYIGRPSPWGNPYHVDQDGTREEVIAKYRLWIRERPELIEQLEARQPKRLMCWCAPQACHGDVLVELLEQRKGETVVTTTKKAAVPKTDTKAKTEVIKKPAAEKKPRAKRAAYEGKYITAPGSRSTAHATLDGKTAACGARTVAEGTVSATLPDGLGFCWKCSAAVRAPKA